MVEDEDDQSISGDHLHLFVTFPFSISCSTAQKFPTVNWLRGTSWEGALQPLHHTLLFIAGWTTLLGRSIHFRQAASRGGMSKLRTALVGLAVWWRSVILALVGHVGNMVHVLLPSKGRPVRTPVVDDWFDPQPDRSLLEMRLREESTLLKHLQLPNQQRIQKHAQLWVQAKSEADGFVSSLLKPKAPVSLALIDAQGSMLDPSQALEQLTCDLLARAHGVEPGDPSLDEWIVSEVKAIRVEALSEAFLTQSDPFGIDEVRKVIQKMKKNSSALHFPRQVIRSTSQPLLLISWALVNTITSLSTQPSSWFRQVCPIRKSGYGPVRNTSILRPVICVDDIENLLDGLWLAQARPFLEEYISMQQTGGRFEHLMVVLGVVLTLQARMVQKFASFLQIADLERGFESVPRDMLRWLLRQAKFTGWQWLIPDVALGKERIRVRVGCLLGSMVILEHNSIGQGERSGVHLFGTYTKTLIAAVNNVFPGAALCIPQVALDALASTPQPCRSNTNFNLCNKVLLAKVCLESGSDQHAWSHIFVRPNCQSACTGTWKACTLPFQQYVDDAILVAPDTSTLRDVNSTLSDACAAWRCKFAGGKKGPRILIWHRRELHCSVSLMLTSFVVRRLRQLNEQSSWVSQLTLISLFSLS